MALIQGWMPPVRENYEQLLFYWQFFPVVTILQYLIEFYPAGKTSITSRLNVPGKIGWLTMEIPGFLVLLYTMVTLPQAMDLPSRPTWQCWLMATLFTLHYIDRAILAPLILNPTMSPIHILVWAMAFCWQIVNGTCIGAWLAGYGDIDQIDWSNSRLFMGLILFLIGISLNIYSDETLRGIRREAQELQHTSAQGGSRKSATIEKLYLMPQNGLFKFVLYPHYLTEWVEWTGFWMMCGWGCIPARTFVLNEIATMLPRALQGRKWYIRKFGSEQVGKRKAVIPGFL